MGLSPGSDENELINGIKLLLMLMQKNLAYIPMVSIAIITIGFVNTYIFYSYFGIPIQNYLSVAEIIFSIASFTISIFILLCAVLYGLITLEEKPSHKPVKESNRLSKYLSKSKYKYVKGISNAFKWSPIILTLATLLVIIFLVYGVFDHSDQELMENSRNYDLDFFILILLSSGLAVFLHQFFRRYTLNVVRMWIIFWLAIVIGIISFLLDRNGKSARFILSGHPKYSISVNTRNATTSSTSDSVFFVGSTQGFYFLRDKPSKQNIIVPASEVVEVRITQLRDGL